MKIGKEKLKQYITETVRKVLNEGHWNNDVWRKWEDAREAIGDDTFIMEMWNFLDGDTLEEFIDHLDKNFDLDFDKEDEEEETEEEDF